MTLLSFILAGLFASCALVFVTAFAWLVLIALRLRSDERKWPRAEARCRWSNALRSDW